MPFGWMEPRDAAMPLKIDVVALILTIGLVGSVPIASGQGSAGSVEIWEVDTRRTEQVMGSSPWTGMEVNRLDEASWTLVRSEPSALFASLASRPAVFLVHGNGYDDEEAITEALQVRGQLAALGGLPEGFLFVVFDWPSERVRRSLVPDLNEKARRSRIAGYHLARFLEATPPGSTICLMGQSDGGRVALTALHLLSGAGLPRFGNEPGARLRTARPDLRLRCVALEAAAGHHWLDPGERLGGALTECEALLNLSNDRDFALAVFVLGAYTGQKAPLGEVGLTKRDRRRLGPLADRVEDIDHHAWSGRAHTLFTQALTFPDVAHRIAAYTSFADVSDGLGRKFKTPKPLRSEDGR